MKLRTLKDLLNISQLDEIKLREAAREWVKELKSLNAWLVSDENVSKVDLADIGYDLIKNIGRIELIEQFFNLDED